MTRKEQQIERAVQILRLLPTAERKQALNFIEFLAFDTCVDLLLEDDAEELLAAMERARKGDRSGTVSLEDVERELKIKSRGRHD